MRFHPLFTALCVATLLHAGAASGQQATPPAAAGTASQATRPGPGPGPRGPMGPRFGQDYTPGWSMMTPQERDDHRQRMHSAKTPDDCRKIVDEHRKLMADRAKERGMGSFRGPRRDACAGWR
jgi:hypothetical protein